MTLLLLAGTAQARRVATALAKANIPAIASLAGATRKPFPLDLPRRTGGFGGAGGFEKFILDQGITAVLDATHPFAINITQRTARMCAERDLPYAILARPPWREGPKESWQHVKALEDVAALVPPAAVVFLATGRQSLPPLRALRARRVLARVIDVPRVVMPLTNGEWVIGRPPFLPEEERAMFQANNVTHLVSKNSGGDSGRAKLDAARDLGVQVIMVERPVLPEGTVLSTEEEAFEWVQHHIASAS